jgi:hypothetical protein
VQATEVLVNPRDMGPYFMDLLPTLDITVNDNLNEEDQQLEFSIKLPEWKDDTEEFKSI